jgi:uncharacterized protein YneF (UPF0154 family)
VPIDSTLSFGAVAAAMSAISLALFGVDYYSLLYGLVGALLALPHVEQMGRWRAVLFVVLSTLAGAVIGNGILAYFASSNRALLIAGCLAGGIVAQALAAALLKNVPRLFDAAIARMFGKGAK